MTLLELKEVIDNLITVGCPNLPVRLECDHGQVAMSLNGVEYAYIEEEEHRATTLYEDDYKEYEDRVPVVLLSAY